MSEMVMQRLDQLGLFESVKSDCVEGVWEVLGRVPPEQEKSDAWGVFIRNVLLLASQRGALESLDFSRYYYLARRTIEIPKGAASPGSKKATQSDMVLVWNWRIRFDGRGEKFLLYECGRIMDTRIKAEAMKAGNIPIEPVIVQGASVVPLGTGGNDPIKTVRLD